MYLQLKNLQVNFQYDRVLDFGHQPQNGSRKTEPLGLSWSNYDGFIMTDTKDISKWKTCKQAF